MTEGRPIRIGMLWHSVNSGNLGVGALTESNLAILRAEAKTCGLVPHFTIIGMRDVESAYIIGPDIDLFPLDTRTLLSPSGYWAHLPQLDCLFDIGAGDSWADIYGWKRFGFLWLTKMLAALRGVPLVFSPQTIGPFTTQPWTAMAKLAMHRAAVIIARDPLSRDVATSMVPSARVVESVDVAFALPFDQPESCNGRSSIRVGINVSGLLFNGGYGRDNAFGLEIDYATLMRNLIAAVLARKDVEVSLFGHVIAPGLEADNDGAVCDLLAAEFSGVTRVPNFPSPSSAKTWIATQDFIVAGRMHACIAAYSAGVPVVPIAYSRKFIGLFEGVLGYRHGVPVKGLSTEAALTHVVKALEQRAALAAEIAIGNETVDAALDRYRAEIRHLFGSLSL